MLSLYVVSHLTIHQIQNLNLGSWGSSHASQVRDPDLFLLRQEVSASSATLLLLTQNLVVLRRPVESTVVFCRSWLHRILVKSDGSQCVPRGDAKNLAT
jgi:hypothetical protein